MKFTYLGLVALFAIGCSAKVDPSSTGAGEGEKKPPATERMPKSEPSAPKEVEKFGDDVFVLPPYPGAEHMAYTGIEMDTDMAHAYARHFTTPDDLDKVEAFIKTEGEKLGKYTNPTKGIFNEKLIRNGGFELPDGKKLVFKLMRDEKGNKTDIMYNMSIPKKK